MTTRDCLIEALQLVEEIDPKGQCCARHDELYIATPDINLTPEQEKRLKKLGFLLCKDGWYCFT